MARTVDDIDVTLLALVSHLQYRLFLLEGKPPRKAERLTRRVVSVAYQMAFGRGASEQTQVSIDRTVERLVDSVTALEALIAEEEKLEEGGSTSSN